MDRHFVGTSFEAPDPDCKGISAKGRQPLEAGSDFTRKPCPARTLNRKMAAAAPCIADPAGIGVQNVRSSRSSCRLSCVVVRSLPGESDAELCVRAQQGDRSALGELLRRHGPRLYRSVLLPRLGSAAAAEEALAATYARVVERFEQFTWQPSGIYPWLRVVALRIALDQMRSRKRERLFAPEDIERSLEDASDRARSSHELEQQDLEQARRRVSELLDRLNPRYAEAIRCRVLEGQPRKDAAERLGVSPATFDVVLHRAMSALKKLLASGLEGEP